MGAQIGNAKIWESKTQKLLVVKIDRTLNFDEHVSSLCKKAGRKLSLLFTLSSYMNVKQKRSLMKSFFWVSVWILSISLDVLQ